MRTVISAEELSKSYRLGLIGTGTLRDDVARWWARLRGRPDPLVRIAQSRRGHAKGEYIWALRDVSFEVKQGEVLGIIGRNGAGKSTLLKILSRITAPTSGEVKVRGRVASLLEVGTGFHPELTGRENVYLNGAILGMTRGEIDRKLDEIVDFSGVEPFIDTPVKRYSSGMYVRLAFAVAAHLEQEILIVDEVLAVGDASFQRKCLDKMEDVGRIGRTVLFVSHNMPAITRLCPRAIVIEDGRLVHDGDASSAVQRLTGDGAGTSCRRVWEDSDRAPGDDFVRLREVALIDTAGAPLAGRVRIDDRLGIRIGFDVIRGGKRLTPGIICYNVDGTCLFSSADLAESAILAQDTGLLGRRWATTWIPPNLLAEGRIVFDAAIYSILEATHPHVYERSVVAVDVVDSLSGKTARGVYGGPVAGVMRPLLEWRTVGEDSGGKRHGSAGMP